MNLAALDLNLLVGLEAILTERHLTRAGERLGVGQPTMSHTLARSRRLFNDDLLIRVGREYQLTPLADQLVGPLQEALRNIDQLITRRPAFDSKTDRRVFTVCASDYATFLVFQPAMKRLQDEAPYVHLEVQPLLPNGREALQAGDIDLAIFPSSMQPDMPHEVLFVDNWVGVTWAGNDHLEETLSLEEFLESPHVAYGTGMQGSNLAERPLLLQHPEARVAMTVQSFFLLPFMLTNTRNVALVHQRMARRLAGMADIKILKPMFETPPISEAIFWHPRYTSDPGHMWLRGLLKECTADMANSL